MTAVLYLASPPAAFEMVSFADIVIFPMARNRLFRFPLAMKCLVRIYHGGEKCAARRYAGLKYPSGSEPERVNIASFRKYRVCVDKNVCVKTSERQDDACKKARCLLGRGRRKSR